MLTYKYDDTYLYIFFSMKQYIETQPRTSEACNEKIDYFKRVIDGIRTKFPEHRQIFVTDLEGVYLSEMYSVRYTIKILSDIHEYTKDDKQLDQIIIRNTGKVFNKVYKLVKSLLPKFIDELLVIEPEDTQKSRIDEEDNDDTFSFVEQELARCIHET